MSEEETKKTVPGQFDNVQIEESEQEQREPSKSEEPSALAASPSENEDKNISQAHTVTQVDGLVAPKDQEDGPSAGSQRGSSEDILDDKSAAPARSVLSPSPKTENELNKCEGTASENTVVEEAAA